MQRLRAVVKTFKADPVCQALLAAGVDEVFVEEVQGYGRQKGHLGLYRQPAYGIAFLPKIAITAYVADELVDAACKAIEEAAATGTIGDGKIFLTPVEYALPHALEMGARAVTGSSNQDPQRKSRDTKNQTIRKKKSKLGKSQPSLARATKKKGPRARKKR